MGTNRRDSLAHRHPYAVAGIAGYLGYRIGKSPRRRRPTAFLFAGLFIVFVLAAFIVLQALKVLVALALTAGYLVFRSERWWTWMRALWGSYIRSYVHVRYPGLTAAQRSLVASRWLEARRLTATFEPRSLQTGPP